jgi:hypothetical protein
MPVTVSIENPSIHACGAEALQSSNISCAHDSCLVSPISKKKEMEKIAGKVRLGLLVFSP